MEIQPIKGDLQKENKEADMSESNRSMPMREIPQSPASEAAVLRFDNIRTGTVKLTFHLEIARFENLAPVLAWTFAEESCKLT